MKKIIISLSLLLSFFSLSAQIQHGGKPYTQNKNFLPFSNNIISLASFDLNLIKQEDAILDLHKDIPFRFGYNFDLNYTTNNSGEWIDLPNGDRLWRITFFSNGAQSLNFLLKDFSLAEGCKLFFHNEDYTSVIGSFTSENNQVHKNLATQLIFGEKITLEFYEPKTVKDLSTFTIKRATHGYRSLKIPLKGVGNSGNCNNNVICSVGDDWRDQIRSVGIIIVGGNSQCTGALVNNTCQDNKPYFLTANHCTDGEDVTTWSIGFNFESADCNTNSGYNSFNYQSINVLALRANNAGSDFSLVELVSEPPASYNVFFAGWDKSGTTPTSQVAIHHPNGDLKKISFDNDPATFANWGGANTWHISAWDDGTTEPGSSGSPLFDQNHRIIGQLFGGSAWCGNNVDDYYGQFHVSWDAGTNNSNQLVSWLDACNTGQNFIDGKNLSSLDDDVAIRFLNKPNTSERCGTNMMQQIEIKNNGTNAVTSVSFSYGLNGAQTYNWLGNLNQNDTEIITLENLYLCKGENYDYSLNITSSNLASDQNTNNDSDNFSFSVTNGNLLKVELKTNYAASETSFSIVSLYGDTIHSENSFSNNELTTYEYCMPNGSYEFKILDSGNNGLTAIFATDSGYYNVFLDGVLIKSNDAFGSEESTSFSTSGNGLIPDFNNTNNQFETVAFDLTSTSIGTITNYEWTAPNAETTTGNTSIFNTRYNSQGNYNVTLKIENDTACDVITKQITVLEYTSISDLDTYFKQNIYPNPTNNSINIETEFFNNTTIVLRNELGKEVYSSQMNSNIETIDLSLYSKGIYFLTMKNKEHISTFKILKE